MYPTPILAARNIQVVVTDGTAVKCARCSEGDCKQPIEKRSLYCQAHRHLKDRCAVVGCVQPVRTGQRTCENVEHQQVEEAYNERGKAFFQLKRRLEHARMASTNDAMSGLTAADLGTLDDDTMDDTLPGDGTRVYQHPTSTSNKIQTKFGRRWTHNEQLVVCPCGMILMRETFYNAEGIASVTVRALPLPCILANTSTGNALSACLSTRQYA